MEIKKIYLYRNELQKLKSLRIELAQHESFNPYKSGGASDMPKGGGGKDFAEWWTEETLRLEREIAAASERVHSAREDLDKIIEAAPEPEASIMRYRTINDLGWDEIADLVRLHRSTVSKKFRDYVVQI